MTAFWGTDSMIIGLGTLLVMGGPVVGGLVAGAVAIMKAKTEARQAPPLFGVIVDFFSLLRQAPNPVRQDLVFAVLLQLAFSLLSLALLIQQMNLLMVLFFHSFATLTVVAISGNLKNFLVFQPVLLAIGAGLGLLTGGFSFATLFIQPGFFVLEMPFLWLCLLIVFRGSGLPVREDAGIAGPQLALMKLAACFRQTTLLVLAGAFWANSFVGAIFAALLIYLAVCLGEFIYPRLSWRVRIEWGYGYLFFACAANLSWLYIKYWL
jgi:hypothetical protein